MTVRNLFLLVFFFSVSGLDAQNESWNDRVRDLSALNQLTLDYKLGGGDLIEVSVAGVKDFNYTLRIGIDGLVNMPYIGRIPVAGLSVVELEEKLKSLLEGDLIRNPQVFVSIKEFHSKPVFILGAVNRPGEYQIARPLTLIDLIAMANGLDLTRAPDYALVQRQVVSNPEGDGGGNTRKLEVIKVNLKELLEAASPELNLTLQAGDVIQIPPRVSERFFILGDVNTPGAFNLPNDRDLLVTQALAWAGGPSKTAKFNKGTLIRYEKGKRTEAAVNYKDIVEGKKPDFIVRPDDIIFISGSRFKTVGYALLGLLPTVGSAAASGTGARIP